MPVWRSFSKKGRTSFRALTFLSVTITVAFADKRRNRVEIDASEHEIGDLIGKGREIKRRGRKPGSRNRPKDGES